MSDHLDNQIPVMFYVREPNDGLLTTACARVAELGFTVGIDGDLHGIDSFNVTLAPRGVVRDVRFEQTDANGSDDEYSLDAIEFSTQAMRVEEVQANGVGIDSVELDVDRRGNVLCGTITLRRPMAIEQ